VDYFGENVRFLLWNAHVRREDWARQLASWLLCDESRATRLLSGAQFTPSEQSRIAEVSDLADEDLVHGRLVELAGNLDILKANLQLLLDLLPYGRKKVFAQSIGVKPRTVSDWLAGRQRPERDNLRAVGRHFGLPENIDLTTEPLFVTFEPFGESARREWVRRRIGEIDTQTLDALFPALRKLLGE
jgi:hypothetical protein